MNKYKKPKEGEILGPLDTKPKKDESQADAPEKGLFFMQAIRSKSAQKAWAEYKKYVKAVNEAQEAEKELLTTKQSHAEAVDKLINIDKILERNREKLTRDLELEKKKLEDQRHNHEVERGLRELASHIKKLELEEKRDALLARKKARKEERKIEKLANEAAIKELTLEIEEKMSEQKSGLKSVVDSMEAEYEALRKSKIENRGGEPNLSDEDKEELSKIRKHINTMKDVLEDFENDPTEQPKSE